MPRWLIQNGRVARFGGISVVVASGVWACAEQLRLGTSSDDLVTTGILGTDSGIGQTGFGPNEPTATWSFGLTPSGLSETFVIGHNPRNTWSFSINGGASFTDCSPFMPGCNANGGFDAGALGRLLGNPTVVSDGRGHVVYLSLLDTNADPNPATADAESVMAVVSVDAGQTSSVATFGS